MSNALLKAQQMRIPWNLCHDKVHNLNKRTIWEEGETQSQKQERKQACVCGRQGETEQTLFFHTLSSPRTQLGDGAEAGPLARLFPFNLGAKNDQALSRENVGLT